MGICQPTSRSDPCSPGMSYILRGPALPLISLWSQFQGARSYGELGFLWVWVASHLQVECSRRSIPSGFTVLPQQLFF